MKRDFDMEELSLQNKTFFQIIREKLEAKTGFYLRRDRLVAATCSLWLLYAVVFVIVIWNVSTDAYELILVRNPLFFVYLFWLLFFLNFWSFSINTYPRIWRLDRLAIYQKWLFSGLLLLALPSSILLHRVSMPSAQEWFTTYSVYEVLLYLRSPYVIGFLAFLFYAFLRLNRKGLAAGILAFVGYYHVFLLIPEKTGHAVQDLKALFLYMDSMGLIFFLVSTFVLTVAVLYILFLYE